MKWWNGSEQSGDGVDVSGVKVRWSGGMKWILVERRNNVGWVRTKETREEKKENMQCYINTTNTLTH